jgi:hypothetical protein
VPGVHFIKLDRIIRFEWGPELIRNLHEISSQPEPPTEEVVEIEHIINPKRLRYGKINFDI